MGMGTGMDDVWGLPGARPANSSTRMPLSGGSWWWVGAMMDVSWRFKSAQGARGGIGSQIGY